MVVSRCAIWSDCRVEVVTLGHIMGDTGHWAAHSVRDSSGTEVDTLDTAMWLFVLLLAGMHHTTASPVSYYSFELKITTTIK